VEIVVTPNINFIKSGILIGFVMNLGGLDGVSVRRNFNRSSRTLVTNIGVVGTSQMVFTNLIMTIHVNRIIDRPSMSSIVAKGYISTYVRNPRRGYEEPFVVTIKIPDHINGHFVRPNMVTFKYPDFKKDVDLDAHIKKCSILQ
jgi:hypothetical protein